MKKNSMKRYIIPMLLLAFAVTAWLGVRQASGAVQQLEEIEAFYVGAPVAVGEEIKLKDFWVTGKYKIQDGSGTYETLESIKKGFTISPTVINKKGDNPIVVTYQGKKYVVMVEGKSVESIIASYNGEEVYVGATIPLGKIDVQAIYSDYSQETVKNFTLSDTKVLKEGDNVIAVTYQGKTDYIHVFGKAPLAVEAIDAYYIGEPIIEGNSINKGNIIVNLTYNDGTYKENVTNFNISPGYVMYEGENEITVTYGDVSTTIYVYGMERYITEMRAKYTGPGVIVGKKVKKEDIEVIVTYNDGSDEAIEDFELFGEEILFDGENVVLVYCDSFYSEVIVPGAQGFSANYDNVISDYFTSPDEYFHTEVTLGMHFGLEPEKFTLREADPTMLEYMVQRVVPTEDFVGFELEYDDDEMVTQFPMAMKVTVPDGFDPEKFGVYYTPNRSTIMAKVDGEFVDETQEEYEFIVYEPGAYILVHEVSNKLVTEIIVETEIKLRENRNYSLNPVVFPLTAENREVSFRSTDEDVATVSSNGKIRTHSEGTCEIWVEAEDGSGVYVIVEVEVTNGK